MIQRQIIIDLYNALGWNPGRRPTKVDDQYAWWKATQAALDIAVELESFATAARMRELFGHVQAVLSCKGCNESGGYTLSGRAKAFRVTCRFCHTSLNGKGLRDHLAHLVSVGELGIDIRGLIKNPSRLNYRSLPADLGTRVLSRRSDLVGLLRTQEFANQRDSLVHALARVLHPDDEEEVGMNWITTNAVEWLQANLSTVANSIGSNRQDLMDAALSRLLNGEDRSETDDVLLLRAVAGRYSVPFAHLVQGYRSYTCQVIPIDSTGPLIGLVLVPSGGYELFGNTSANATSSPSPVRTVNAYLPLLEQLQGVPALARFFQRARGAISCPACNAAAPVLNLDGGQRQFRLVCKLCKAKFNRGNSLRHFSDLMEQGVLTFDLAELIIDQPFNEPRRVYMSSDEEGSMPDLGDSLRRRPGSDSPKYWPGKAQSPPGQPHHSKRHRRAELRFPRSCHCSE
jgi:hypothetical protein